MMIAWSCVPYLVFMLALSRPYSSSTAIYPAQLFKAGYDLGSGTQVYFFFVVYGVLLWWLHQVRVPVPSSVWRVSFAILLVYYQFSYFDLHYWVWIAGPLIGMVLIGLLGLNSTRRVVSVSPLNVLRRV